MKKHNLFIFALQFLYFTASSQEKYGHLTFGYTIATYDVPSINDIFSEANADLDSNVANTPGFKVYSYYEQPNHFTGLSISGTLGSKHWASSFGFRSKKIVTYADGEANITSTGNPWSKGLKIQQTNFFYDLQWNMIYSKYLRMGPCLGFDASILKGSIKNGEEISHQAFLVESTSFTLDGTASFCIVFGSGFQIFVKPYIQYSAFKASLWDFEVALNGADGHQQSDYEFMIKNYGIIFGASLGGKRK